MMERRQARCLSCLRQFDVKPPGRKKPIPSPQSFPSRFNKFAKEHLELPQTVLNALSSGFTSGAGAAGGGMRKTPPPLFCEECENLLDVTCKLFEGMSNIRSELASKLSEWGERLEMMKWNGEGEGEMLAGRMKLNGGEEAVELMRKEIANRCKQKAGHPGGMSPPGPTRRIMPKVTLAPFMRNANTTFTPGTGVSVLVQKALQKGRSASASSTSFLDKLNNRGKQNQEVNVPRPPNSCSIIRTGSGVRIERASKANGTGSGSITSAYEHCDDSRGDGYFRAWGNSKNAAMEAVHAILLPRDIEVCEVDEPESDNSNPYKPNDVDEGNMINAVVKEEEGDSRGESDEEPEEVWVGGLPENPLNMSDAAVYPKPKRYSGHNSSASSAFQPFSIRDYVMGNARTSQGDGSGNGMMLPVDMTVNKRVSGQYAFFRETPRAGGMHVVSSYVNRPPLKRRKMAASGSTLQEFVDLFIRRRRELKLSQTDVANSLGNMYGHDDELFSQTTVSRFEAMNLSENNMAKLRHYFQIWLQFVDPATTTVTDANPPPLQRRKKRTALDREITGALEEYFQQNPTPDSIELAELAQELQLEKEVIRVWFNNRRQKEKRIMSQSGGGT